MRPRLRGFFIHLRRGWKLIAALTVLGMLAGLLITARMVPVYTVRGVVRIPWTWDLAARDPAALVTSALRMESVSKGRGIAVARMILRDIMGKRLQELAPVQLSVNARKVEGGQRRLEEFLAEANRAPDIMKIVEAAQTMARQEIDRIDQELAGGRSADAASLIERRQKLERDLDAGSVLGWDLQPWSDGRDVGQSKKTIVLIGTFLGVLLGILGALARWPRFMMS
jgi:hypothetical protein